MGVDVTCEEFLNDCETTAAGANETGECRGGEFLSLSTGNMVLAPALTQKPASERITTELPVPATYEADRPLKTEYEADVLVVGGGYAGINAAFSARQAGRDVILLDKGRPGYSGQSPWPGTFNYFDPELGDDRTAFREYVRYSSEYFGNLDWIDIWMDESKAMKERIEQWGLLDMYPQMFETEYWKTRDYYGYRDNVVGSHERRPKFVEILNDNNIPWLQHVMVTNIIIQDGKCAGAVGFQFTTGEIITVHAKAVVLAAGNGCIIPTGHLNGDNTFDGEIMAYDIGLPIGGKEFEDFHFNNSFAPGCGWLSSDARFFDPNFLCGGNIRRSGDSLVSVKAKKEECDRIEKHPTHPEGLPYLDTAPWSLERSGHVFAQAVNFGTNPEEKRIGKMISPYVRLDAPGGAVGMCLHLASGVFCGMDDVDGYTGIPGLWVAGDGVHLTNPGGANYEIGNGFTSCFVSICGDHAGRSASAYCMSTQLARITKENLDKAKEEITQPLKLEKGFNPNWARDVLQGIMAPYWVIRNKSEPMLKAALTQVLYMQENVADRLLARTGHDLRLCHEVKHKLTACELKLRASIARKESRGKNFFREDYPRRDDSEWLKYIILKKGPDGKPVMTFEPVKKEWTAAGIPADFTF